MALLCAMQVTLLLLLLFSAVAKAEPAIAKPGCRPQCGNVSVPYPFGIGLAECYLDEWFAIDCNETSSPPKLIIRSINMEALDIDLRGTVRVRSPIISSPNCSSPAENREGVSLQGSPYVFSSSQNMFTAIGCNNFAVMTDIDPTVVGCKADCDSSRNNSRKFNCTSGFNCCQTTPPSDLKVFNAGISNIDGHRSNAGECKYAFLVEKDWFSNERDPILSIEGRGFTPVVLNWKIYEWNNNSQALFASMWNRREVSCDLSAIQYPENEIRILSVLCHCSTGYKGNPYLHAACVDINECEDPKLHTCNSAGDCENTIGGYNCDKRKTKMKIAVIVVGTTLAVLLLLLITWWLYKVIKKRNETKLKKKNFKRNGGMLLKQRVSSNEDNVQSTRLFNSRDLEKATDHFNKSRILGQGGQGTVYKGMLVDGKIVAIKKSTVVDEANLEQFINEVVILSQINHRNVVKLLGCCLETQVPLLVYEFIPNGTLFQYLHEQNEEFPLTWELRLRIATEVAGALTYLHSAASLPIYHRDIKSTNILLDDKYRAKVADFGTSRSVAAIDQTHITTQVCGTFGYLDPQYFQTSQFTEKSDVYSFGVVLVELLTGEKAVSSMRSQEGKNLATYFIIAVEANHLHDILDARVKQEGRIEEIIAVAELAKRCLNLNGRNRPTMREVVIALEGIRKGSNIRQMQEEFE
ncbi:wall-associated receptor kinase-like 10 [Malania oleifera]|uniref:wall-associated receptor kinase-like 10 n=1 Tax=Malania oleifera TaxID=397392 RepID=UPI0025ADAF45|nr:wall-associated receptor kinase-like 10 [Malania oleifera]